MKLTIFMDNLKSWYYPYAKKLKNKLARKHDVVFCSKIADIRKGDCLFLLSVEEIIKKDVLDRNTHNIVVHSSPLPKGKGWSPITWQIIEGKNIIANTLFEAVEKVDAGPIYKQEKIQFEGHELLSEIHKKQAESINRLVQEFVDEMPHVHGRNQHGKATYYLRRNSNSSELDINRSIARQFNLLRVVDNKKYPAFFHYKGHKYLLKIYKAKQLEK